MRSPYYPFIEERSMLGVIDDAVVGAVCETRLESRIIKVNPIPFMIAFSGKRWSGTTHSHGCAYVGQPWGILGLYI